LESLGHGYGNSFINQVAPDVHPITKVAHFLFRNFGIVLEPSGRFHFGHKEATGFQDDFRRLSHMVEMVEDHQGASALGYGGVSA